MNSVNNNVLIQKDSLAFSNIDIDVLRPKNEKIEQLKKPWSGYKIVICLDTSKSMNRLMNRSKSESLTRFEYVQNNIKQLFEKSLVVDPSGVGFIAFGTKVKELINFTTADKIEEIVSKIKPSGITNTAGLLEACFRIHKGYLNNPELNNKIRGTIFLVLTDGLPTVTERNEEGKKTVDDSNRVKGKLVDFSYKVATHTEVGITFLRVGDNKKAIKFFTEIDDDLVDPETKVPVDKDIIDHKSFRDLVEKTDELSFERLLFDSLYD